MRRIVIGASCTPARKISGEFVITCGDSAEVLELIKEALDEVAFAIERKVARALGLTVILGWNDRSNPRWVKSRGDH